ncbi:MAG: hypothetical protein R3A12_04410 [Ignavibacteria bacterium]
MRKIILAIIVCFLIADNSFSQSNNYNWITPNKTYLKLYINDDGVYRINKVDFENAGISTSGLDPRTVKYYTRERNYRSTFRERMMVHLTTVIILIFTGKETTADPHRTETVFPML